MKKEKKDFLMYQWLFFVPFSVLAAIGALVTSLIAIFIGISSLKYVVASFMLESERIFPAFVLTIICLGVCACLVYSVVLLIKKYIKSVEKFKKEKAEIENNNEIENIQE